MTQVSDLDPAVIGEHTWLSSPRQAMGSRRHARERKAGGKLTQKTGHISSTIIIIQTWEGDGADGEDGESSGVVISMTHN